MKQISALAGVLALAISLAGCGHTSSPTAEIDGTLIAFRGGPALPQRGPIMHGRPAPGLVRLTDSRGKSIDVHVGRSGRFTVSVPVGRYYLQAGEAVESLGSCRALYDHNTFDQPAFGGRLNLPPNRIQKTIMSRGVAVQWLDLTAGEHLPIGVGCLAF